MAQTGKTLVSEVGVGLRRRAHSLLKLIAFACHGMSSQTSNSRGEELRMARRLLRLLRLLGAIAGVCDRGGRGGGCLVAIRTAARIYAKEVSQAVTDLASRAIGLFR